MDVGQGYNGVTQPELPEHTGNMPCYYQTKFYGGGITPMGKIEAMLQWSLPSGQIRLINTRTKEPIFETTIAALDWYQKFGTELNFSLEGRHFSVVPAGVRASWGWFGNKLALAVEIYANSILINKTGFNKLDLAIEQAGKKRPVATRKSMMRATMVGIFGTIGLLVIGTLLATYVF